MSEVQIVVFSAPSGAGKNTVINKVREAVPNLEFAISATTRQPRDGEVHGCHYYFLSNEDFIERMLNSEFLETEQVYDGVFYGTLSSEIDRILLNGNLVVMDVDTVGAVNIKRIFVEQALSIFIVPPSIEVLEERLRARGTETEEKIVERLQKAKAEMKKVHQFDARVVNDDLELCVQEIVNLISKR